MDRQPVVIIGGVPRIMAPRPASKGLWFIGYQLGPSMLGVAGKQSRPLARVIANDLAVQQNPENPGTETDQPAWT